MEPRFVAITGTNHCQGTQLARIDMTVKLTKEPDNLYDEEAIMAEIPPYGKIGYVANSVHTVPRGCQSAGRIYDSFGHTCTGTVRIVFKDTIIVVLQPTETQHQQEGQQGLSHERTQASS